MKGKVSVVQRLNWKPLGYPMHFCCSERCTFRLATLIEQKIVVSTIGEFRPGMFEGKMEMESLGGYLREDDKTYYETYVFRVESFAKDGVPNIGKQLDGTRCRTADEAYALHTEMCEKFQLELNMGMHR